MEQNPYRRRRKLRKKMFDIFMAVFFILAAIMVIVVGPFAVAWSENWGWLSLLAPLLMIGGIVVVVSILAGIGFLVEKSKTRSELKEQEWDLKYFSEGEENDVS